MKKLEIYDGTKTYMFPSGKIATPEIMKKEYPAILAFKHVIITNDAREVCFSILPFATLKSDYSIESSLTDEDAIEAIEEILNTPEPEAEPTAEERIASALEFQNLMSMPDEEESV